ncbi:EGF domain-containing protein [Archangium lansingense]|uniref:EGF domain-containing protein n=1 Tax=Archangium lansingense TaxID=2995310 RepID=UPI003B7C12E9
MSKAFILLAILAASACSNPDPTDGPDSPKCVAAACDANAACDTSSGQAVCTCNTGYSGDGKTCTDVNECATAGRCAADATCTNTPGSFTCACKPGFSGDGQTCADVDECAANTDNCSDNATCTNVPGGFSCACKPGYSGNGLTCTAQTQTGRVLVFADGAGTTSNPVTAAAATSLGITVTVTRNEQDFVASFDAGGFEVVVVESETVPLPANVQSRLTSWVQGDGKALVAHPALNQITALQDLLEVDAAAPFTTWRDVYAVQDLAPNLFEQHQTLPHPLAPGTSGTARGVQLTPRGSGLKLAALDSATGAGAIVATRDQHVLVHGFRASDVAQVDKDTDGVPDVQELHANELLYLLNPRVLVFDDYPLGGRFSAKAVTQLKMTALYTSTETQFNTTYDRGGFQLLVLQTGTKDLPTAVETRTRTWVKASNRAIVSCGDLDQHYNLQLALDVTVKSFQLNRQVHAVPSSPQNFFSLRETLPSPLSGNTYLNDSGDELTLPNSNRGFIAARFDSATGPGAISVTRENKVIVNGFVLLEMDTADGDSDGKPDVQELLVNELVFLGAP